MKRILWQHYLLLILLACLIIPNASAFISSSTYDPNSRIVTIYDWFGLDKVADVRLDTPLINHVIAGKDRLVAEFTVNLDNAEYRDFLSKMELLNNYNGKKMQREINYKYKVISAYEIDVDDFKQVCETLSNKSLSCHNEKSGTHRETKYKEEWIPIKKLDLEKGIITIGIFADVYKGDNVEWIPTMFGERIDEWATWQEGYNTNLLAYWELNESSGTAYDAMGVTNLTNAGTVTYNAGKIGNAANFSGNGNDKALTTSNASLGAFGTGNFTLNFWFKEPADGNYQAVIADDTTWIDSGQWGIIKLGDVHGAHYIKWQASSCELIADDAAIDNDAWHMVTFMRNGTGTNAFHVYINGAKDNAATCATNFGAGDGFFMGANAGLGYGMDGLLDEVGVWGRALSASEITSLYNGGYGLTYTNSFPFINATLMSPDDGYTTNVATNSFSCNATAEDTTLGYLSPLMYYPNDTQMYYDETEASGTFNQTDWDYTLPEDGAYKWTCWASDAGTLDYIPQNRTIYYDTTPPESNITNPTQNEILSYDASGYDVNFTVSDATTIPVTCLYYENDVPVPVTCGENVTGRFTEVGEYRIMLEAIDAAGNDANTSVYNVTVFNWLDYDYADDVIEGSSNIFHDAINISDNVTVVPIFQYNISQYTSGITEYAYGSSWADGKAYNRTFTALAPHEFPSTNFGWQWHFNMTYNGRQQNFSDILYTQTVYKYLLGTCNNSVATKALNVTFLDESTSARMNATVDSALFYYYAVSSSSYKTFTFSNLTHGWEDDFCIYPNWTTINTSVSFKYSHSETSTYPQRTWGETLLTFTNSTLTKSLYLLPSTEGQYVSFQVMTGGYIPITNVDVKVERLFGATYEQLTMGITDATGIITFWLNPNYQHRLTFTKTGFATKQDVITPTQTQYTVIMAELGAASNVTDMVSGITLNIYPSSYMLNNNTNYYFNVSLSSSSSTIQQFGFNITNGTKLFGSNISTANGGNLSLYLNTGGNKTLYLTAFYNISNTTAQFTRIYYITAGAYPVGISTFVSDAKAYLDDGLFGMTTGSFGVQLLIFVIIFITVGVSCYSLQLYSPLAISGILFTLVFTFDSVFEMMANPVGAISHFPTIFTGIIFIAIAIKEATTQ